MRAGKLKRKVSKAGLEQRWGAFADLAGTPFVAQGGTRKWELLTTRGDIWATADSGHIFTNGEAYEERSVGSNRPDGDWSDVIEKTVWVVDRSETPVLRFEGRHFERRAYTKVILRDQSTLRFPFTGRWDKSLVGGR